MLRPYQTSDLPALKRFIGENWKRDKFTNYHPSDFVHWMNDGHLGEKLEQHFHVVEEAGQIIAVVHLDAKSGMCCPVMDTSKRGMAWELEFHRAYIAKMTELMRDVENNTLLISFVEGDTIAKGFLEQLGLKGEKSDYVQNKHSLDTIPEITLPDGFSIRSVVGEHEAQKLADVHNGAFGPKWDEGKYRKVMQAPGYDAERELVVVAPDGRFAAFAIIWFDPISRSGLFEPVGCHSDFRRNGLTKALMFEGMKRMKAEGMEVAYVGCESEVACKFYKAVGFETYFETIDYTLELESI